jgi:hypothetical protein
MSDFNQIRNLFGGTSIDNSCRVLVQIPWGFLWKVCFFNIQAIWNLLTMAVILNVCTCEIYHIYTDMGKKDKVQQSVFLLILHVIEWLCYNWRFANFWLEIGSHNWRFFINVFIDVFDACFNCLLMFSFCLFQYWTNCIIFQYVLFTFLS